MTAHQAGCCCEGCCECDEGFKDFNWIVDLGVGGWVDDCCEGCDVLQGEFTSSTPFGCTIGSETRNVIADFTVPFPWCGVINCTDKCNAGDQPLDRFRLQIFVNDFLGQDNKCDYLLRIFTAIGLPCGNGTFDGAGSIAVRYEKNNVAKTDCSGTEWITLIKVSEHNVAFNGSPANKFWCTGTMPDTIRVRRDL